MKTKVVKPDFEKNQRVYFLHNTEIQYGRIIKILPYKYEKKILHYSYYIEYREPDIYSAFNRNLSGDGKQINCIESIGAYVFNDKKSLIKTLGKWSKNIEKYFEEEIRRKK